MKKHTIFFLLFVILTLTACDKNKQYGSINDKLIITRIQYNSIVNEINQNYYKHVFSENDAIVEYKKNILPTTKDGVIEQLERDFIVINECQKYDILISKEKAKEMADFEYHNIKNSEDYYIYLIEVLSSHNIEEIDYLNMVYNYAFYKYNYINFQEYFKNNLFDYKSQKSLSVQMKEYIQECKRR